MWNGKRVWRIARWPLLVLVVGYLAVVASEVNWPVSEEKTAATVAAIHAQRLTMADVDGSNLPPEPDPKKVNASIEGVDANENGIRDDVELEIFKKYPNNKKVRAAELQYALELQKELTSVLNSETYVAVIQQEGRAYSCISDTEPRLALTATPAENFARTAIVDARVEEVEKVVFNTSKREAKWNDNYDSFMTSYSSLNGPNCDVASR